MSEVVRELTSAERMKYGDCPVCHAKHGQPCDANIGIPLGMSVNGQPPLDGAHLGRLQRAPVRVREIPV